MRTGSGQFIRLKRAVFFLLLALSGSMILAADEESTNTDNDEQATVTEPAEEQATEPAGQPAAGDEALATGSEEDAEQEEDENFVPSVQISEDLSVAFPTDI